MSGSTIFFTMMLALVMFSGFLTYYGVNTPQIASQITGPVNCDINNVPDSCRFPQYSPPTPSNTTQTQSSATPFPQCLLFFVSCFSGTVSTITNTGNAIWNGLVQVSYAMGYISVFTYVFFNKLVQSIFLIYGITQIMGTDFGIPFLGFIWTGFTVFMIIWGISIVKPAGSTG